MGRTNKSDSNLGNHNLGNGATVLTPAFPLLDFGKFSLLSDFTINPPNVKIDPEMRMIIEKESEKLRYKTLQYGSKNENDWQLGSILKSADGSKDNAKIKLTKDGKSAAISEVSKTINASSLDHSSKFLLSHMPLYVYALSHSIYYEQVNDAEGINDRVLVATETKIKPYFNRALAKKIIKDRHLDLNKAQKQNIFAAAETTNISYLKGEPVKAINKIISKFVDYGNLHELVDKFFESGKIDPAKGTPQIRQLMVNYLVDIGLQYSPEEEKKEKPKPEPPIPARHPSGRRAITVEKRPRPEDKPARAEEKPGRAEEKPDTAIGTTGRTEESTFGAE